MPPSAWYLRENWCSASRRNIGKLSFYSTHGMDVAAAARSMGVPEGTLIARLARGREILRNKLAGRQHE